MSIPINVLGELKSRLKGRRDSQAKDDPETRTEDITTIDEPSRDLRDRSVSTNSSTSALSDTSPVTSPGHKPAFFLGELKTRLRSQRDSQVFDNNVSSDSSTEPNPPIPCTTNPSPTNSSRHEKNVVFLGELKTSLKSRHESQGADDNLSNAVAAPLSPSPNNPPPVADDSESQSPDVRRSSKTWSKQSFMGRPKNNLSPSDISPPLETFEVLDGSIDCELFSDVKKLTVLSHNAALHKMAIRPKKTYGPSRRKQSDNFTLDPSVTIKNNAFSGDASMDIDLDHELEDCSQMVSKETSNSKTIVPGLLLDELLTPKLEDRVMIVTSVGHEYNPKEAIENFEVQEMKPEEEGNQKKDDSSASNTVNPVLVDVRIDNEYETLEPIIEEIEIKTEDDFKGNISHLVNHSSVEHNSSPSAPSDVSELALQKSPSSASPSNKKKFAQMKFDFEIQQFMIRKQELNDVDIENVPDVQGDAGENAENDLIQLSPALDNREEVLDDLEDFVVVEIFNDTLVVKEDIVIDDESISKEDAQNSEASETTEEAKIK